MRVPESSVVSVSLSTFRANMLSEISLSFPCEPHGMPASHSSHSGPPCRASPDAGKLAPEPAKPERLKPIVQLESRLHAVSKKKPGELSDSLINKTMPLPRMFADCQFTPTVKRIPQYNQSRCLVPGTTSNDHTQWNATADATAGNGVGAMFSRTSFTTATGQDRHEGTVA